METVQTEPIGVFHTVPLGFYRILPNGQVVDANPALLRMLGFPQRESLLAIEFSRLFSDPSECERWWASLRDKDGVRGFETLFRCYHGTEIWVEHTTWGTSDGPNLFYEGFVTDVTERKRADSALREREERFRAAFEQSPLGLSIFSAEGECLEMNGAFERIWGPWRERTIGTNLLRGKTYYSRWFQSFLQRAIDGETVYLPAVNFSVHAPVLQDVMKDNWLQVWQSPIHDEAGNVHRVLYSHSDNIDSALVEQMFTRRVVHLEALDAVTAAINGSVALNEGLETVLEITLHLLFSDGAILYQLNENDHSFSLLVQRGLSDDAIAAVEAWERVERHLGSLVDSNRSHLELNLTDAPPSGALLSITEGWRWALGVPLRVKGSVLGVMVVFRRHTDSFDKAHIGLLKSIGNSVAIAVDNAQLLEDLRQHSKELQVLSHRVMTAQEEERKRISQELHDEMGQTLTTMRINLASIHSALAPQMTSATMERLLETSLAVDEMLERVRELSHDLRPTMLDDLGLVPTLRWHISKFAQRLNIEINFEVLDIGDRLGSRLDTAIFRIIQEALTNIARHANASRVLVRLEGRDSLVVAVVEDNGQGFDVFDDPNDQTPGRGMGILSMRERVTSLGGSFRLESRKGEGTRLRLEIPLDHRSIDQALFQRVTSD